MSTILIYTSPARGHLYPMMDVSIALRESGHRVVVQTLASERDVVLAEGIEHRAISPEIEALDIQDYLGSNPLKQFQLAMECWLSRAPHEVKDLRTAVAELHPDLLVIDANSWGASAYAAAQPQPWAMFLPYALPVPSPDTPAFGPGFAPPRNWLDRQRDRLVWAVQNASTRKYLKKLNALRAQTGAAPLRRTQDIFQQADLLLYLTAEPFEYPRADWPEMVEPIGPGLWAPPGQVPDWLQDMPRPRVLVSVSTEFQEDGAIIETALAALAGEPGSLIVTTAAIDPEKFSAPNDRVRITRFLPHAQVIPKMDVVVTHGGMGTTQRSLAEGVPVCVVPWGRDQSESARRAVQSGAGTMVPRSKLDSTRLREAVREASLRTSGAQQVAQAFRAAGGGARGASLLEGLIARSERDPQSVSD
ncbi:MAG: glycosyltransferase [Actinobacteria bacterium]|nr:glycosyltransferase [Actinomycetota bacterium]